MDEATVVASHSAPETPAGKGSQKPHRTDPSMPVRSADLEPYTGLGYLSKLFKLMAAVLLLLLLSEIVTGLIAGIYAALRRGRWQDAITAWTRALEGEGEEIDRGGIEKKITDARSRVR